MFSATVSVIVQVIGPSENPPTFDEDTQTVSVAEGSPFQTNITVIIAGVIDDDLDDILPQYTIMAGNENRHLAVELLTGRIYVTGGLRDPGGVGYIKV